MVPEHTTEAIIAAVLTLAISLRDDGAETVASAAQAALDAAGGDPIAAVTVAAALIRIDQPVDTWWQRGLDGIAAAPSPDVVDAAAGRKGHGNHASFNLHKKRGEEPCGPCVNGEREYQRARYLRRASGTAAA